ncbi:MAG TPA: HD domain-containing protein [Nitrospira sp.]|nr:HD domain-containing protein [Nitrospira sp.]
MKPAADSCAPLIVPRSLVSRLMRLYDVPHPLRRGRVIRGYDRSHALRTARMCAAVASALGHGQDRVRQYQIACLLHDLGRAGLDRQLFGKIWSWAKAHGIPTRPREWRAIHPETTYGRETEAFIRRYRQALEADGIPMTAWAKEQVEMRLGYARRLARRLRVVRSSIRKMGVRWEPWMQLVMLYYYYPEKLTGAKPWVKQLAEVLVACEQFEAYSNLRRGRDYYVRKKETIVEAFAYLEKLEQEGILSRQVMKALKQLAVAGEFDGIISQARGHRLTSNERALLRRMEP